MRLTNITILAIRGSDGINKKLADALKVSVSTVNRYIKDNDDNLTKAAALDVIRQIPGLPDQILEEESATAA